MTPLSVAVPKELLPMGDRPLLQWAVEEAVAAGADHIHLVVSPEKKYDNFFHPPDAYLKALNAGGESAKNWARILHRIRVSFSVQEHPLGLGHAVQQAAGSVAEERFFVQLPDEWYPQQTCLSTMADMMQDLPGACLAVMEVPADMTDRYGIVDVEPDAEGRLRVRDMVEKPDPGQAPSRLAITGRYLLPTSLFEILQDLPPGKGGEIQLTDALRLLLATQPVYALPLQESRWDTGTLTDYQTAWQTWLSHAF